MKTRKEYTYHSEETRDNALRASKLNFTKYRLSGLVVALTDALDNQDITDIVATRLHIALRNINIALDHWPTALKD